MGPICDLHGPVTPEQAALMVRGEWKPDPTGHLCPLCQEIVSKIAKGWADRIDAHIAEEVYREVYGKR